MRHTGSDLPFVMQEVMSQIVAYVSEETSTEHRCSDVPIPREDGM